MSAVFERLAEEDPVSAARHYGFKRTARAIGDVPLDRVTIDAALRAHYSPGRIELLAYGKRPLFWGLR